MCIINEKGCTDILQIIEFLWVFGSHFHRNSSRRKLSWPSQTGTANSKPLRIRRSRKQCDRYFLQIAFLCPITEKRSDESWNWYVKSSIPGALSFVLENFRRPLFQTRLTAPGSPRICPFQNGPTATKFLSRTALPLFSGIGALLCNNTYCFPS